MNIIDVKKYCTSKNINKLDLFLFSISLWTKDLSFSCKMITGSGVLISCLVLRFFLLSDHGLCLYCNDNLTGFSVLFILSILYFKVYSKSSECNFTYKYKYLMAGVLSHFMLFASFSGSAYNLDSTNQNHIPSLTLTNCRCYLKPLYNTINHDYVLKTFMRFENITPPSAG